MKRIIGVLILVVMTLSSLVGCGMDMPRPEIREGEFDFSVSYELDGEVKTVNDTYVCKYGGVAFTLEAVAYRSWKGEFKGNVRNGDTIKVCDTDDGGEIIISLLIYPEYFMGEPGYADFIPTCELALYYYDEQGYISDSTNDEDVLAGYGVRFISCEYSDPITNTFK